MTNTLTPTVEEAAALEGLIAIDGDIEKIRRIQAFQTLRDQKNDIEAKMGDLKTAILTDIDELDAQALTLNGEVLARRSEVTTTRVDAKKLKETHPEIYGAFLKVTQAIRLTVSS